MKDYSIEVETVSAETKAVLIGGEYIAQKLSLVLRNRGLSPVVISSYQDLDLSASPEFIFLFTDEKGLLPEVVLNFVESIRAKLIIVSVDKSPGESVARQCLLKNIDFCSVSIYDLYAGGDANGILGVVFSEIKNQKLYSFKNDQIIVTPIYIDDAVEGLCRVAFSTQTFKKNLLLTGKEEIPLVGFTRRVGTESANAFDFQLKAEEYQRIYPDGMARHEKILKRDEFYSSLNWKPETHLSEGINLALEIARTLDKPLKPQVPEIKKDHQEIKKK